MIAVAAVVGTACITTGAVIISNGGASRDDREVGAVTQKKREDQGSDASGLGKNSNTENADPGNAALTAGSRAGSIASNTSDRTDRDSLTTSASLNADDSSRESNSLDNSAEELVQLNERIRTAAHSIKPRSPKSLVIEKLCMGVGYYADAFDCMPAIDGAGWQASTGLSWRVFLLPFLDHAPLYGEFRLEEPWNSPHNRQFITRMPDIFGKSPDGKTRWHVFSGAGTPLQMGRGTTAREITDGASNTLLIVEAGNDQAEIWTKPGGLSFDPDNTLAALGDVGSSFLAGLADGQVVEVDSGTPALRNLIQKNDGQAIPTDAYRKLSSAEQSNKEITSSDRPVRALPPLAPLRREIDRTCFPPGTLAAISVHPRQLLEHRLTTTIFPQVNFRGETLMEACLRMDGWSSLERLVNEIQCTLAEVEELHLVMMPAQGSKPAKVDQIIGELCSRPTALKLKSAFPLPAESLVQNFVRHVGEVRLENVAGVTVVGSEYKEAALCFPAEHEVVLGDLKTVKAMLQAGARDRPRGTVAERMARFGNRMFALSASSVSKEDAGRWTEYNGIRDIARSFLGMPVPPLGVGSHVSIAFDLDHPETLVYEMSGSDDQMDRQITAVHTWLDNTARRADYELMLKAIGGVSPATPDHIVAAAVTGLSATRTEDAATIILQRSPHLDELPTALAPVFRKWRAAAIGTVRKNNLREILLAAHNYHDVHDHFPLVGVNQNNQLSWRVHMLAIHDFNLYEEFHLDEPWDSPHNLKLIPRMPTVFGRSEDGKTTVHVLVGENTAFSTDKPVSLLDITSRHDRTVYVVEAGPETAQIWTKPGVLRVTKTAPTACLGTPDPYFQGFPAATVDARFMLIPKSISDKNFLRLLGKRK